MRISKLSADVCASDLGKPGNARLFAGRVPRLRGRLHPRAFALAPPPEKTGGGWEGVPAVRADLEDTPPQPSPAFAGEGAKLAAEAAPTGPRKVYERPYTSS